MYLKFNKLDWFNKKDHLVVPKTVTIKPGAMIAPWANEVDGYSANEQIVTNTKTFNCIGVYSPSSDYVAYAFDDDGTLQSKDNPNGNCGCSWVRSNSNVISNWGGKSHLIYWYQAFKSLFLAREVA